jgi:hypothetical protein
MNNNQHPNNFNGKRLFFVTVPSYVFPAIMSFLPGYFLNKPDLMRASYSTIALPSLITSLLTYIVLWQMEKRQIFPNNKLVRALLMLLLMFPLGFIAMIIFGLQSDAINILPSVFLGAILTSLTQSMTIFKTQL